MIRHRMRLLRLLLSLLRGRRNLSVALGLLVLCLALGMASGLWPLARLAYLLAGLIVVAYLWARLQLWGLSVSPERLSSRVQVGQMIESRITVANRTFLPKLALELQDISDMPGYEGRAVVDLEGHEDYVWELRAQGSRRGLYQVGPVEVASSDPFGFFTFRRALGAAGQVLVYPEVIDLPSFWIPPASLGTESRRRRLTHHITPNVTGVREYMPGDSLKRIHWPTSARTGRLMVKTFEQDPSAEAWVVLDLERRVQAGDGDDSTEEWGVKVAAAVTHHILAARRPLGLVFQGDFSLVLEPVQGEGHFLRILEALAMARAQGTVPLAQLLVANLPRFGRHSSLIVITPSGEASWVEVLRGMDGQGMPSAAILLDASTFGAPGDSFPTYDVLGVSNIPARLVRQGDDLKLALRGPDGHR